MTLPMTSPRCTCGRSLVDGKCPKCYRPPTVWASTTTPSNVTITGYTGNGNTFSTFSTLAINCSTTCTAPTFTTLTSTYSTNYTFTFGCTCAPESDTYYL